MSELALATRERGALAMTADREESKFVLQRSRLAAWVRELRARLPQHEFEGEGRNVLPDPAHFVSTVYFDTSSNALLRAALARSEENVKVRAREYYDLHDSLAELATDTSQIVRGQPWAFCELKRRSGGRTQKRRFRLEKCQVAAFFRGEHPAFAEPSGGADPELGELVDYRRALGQPLVPSVLVNYRRLAFQDTSDTLRITVDVDVGFYTPLPMAWAGPGVLVREALGSPAAVEPFALVEVKRRGPERDWLRAMLARAERAPAGYSKFVRAGQAIHGLR